MPESKSEFCKKFNDEIDFLLKDNFPQNLFDQVLLSFENNNHNKFIKYYSRLLFCFYFKYEH